MTKASDTAKTPGAPHVVVVGAGLAGLRTVERLRRLGHPGPITMIGAESWATYDRPPLSKACLANEDTPVTPYLRPPEGYDELGIDLRLGVAATGLDPVARRLRLDDGTEVVYDELVLATGARAREVPQWSAVPGVLVLRTFDDLLHLRAELAGATSVAVIGAGVLGCEIAAAARKRKVDVDLVDLADQPLARVTPPEVGAVIADLHRERGVRLHLGVGVASLTDGPMVDLTDGTQLSPDLVVVAIGSAPSTEWLSTSGIAVEDGIVVDERGATSAEHVWAVGDVASAPHPQGRGRVRLEHWTAAGDTASRVAAHLLGQEPALPPDVPYVWSDQYELKLQTLGLPDADDELVLVAGSLADKRFLAVRSAGGRVTGAIALGMPAPLARCRSAVAERELVADLIERAPWERKKVST